MLLSHLKGWIKSILHSQSWLISAWFMCLEKQKVFVDDGLRCWHVCHCLVLGASCTIDLTTFKCGSILSICAEDKEDFCYTSGRRNGSRITSILDHSSRGPRLSSTEGGSTTRTGAKLGWKSVFCSGSSKLSRNTKMSSWCPAYSNLARLVISNSEGGIAQTPQHPV